MSGISDYIFGPMIEKNGKVQPFSRADVLVGVTSMGSLMVFILMLYGWLALHEPLNHHTRQVLAISGAISSLILIFHRMRLAWLSAAFAFMAFRLALAVVFATGHRLASAALAVVCAIAAYACLNQSNTHEFQSSSHHATRS